MGIYYPRISKTINRLLTLIAILFLLTSCNNGNTYLAENFRLTELNQNLEKELAVHLEQDKALVAREEAISTRESELVTLLIDLSKKEKALEIEQAELVYAQEKMLAELHARESNYFERNIGARNITTSHADSKNTRIILGGLENIFLDPPGMTFSARIDTGAKTSSLNAVDMVEFERDGKPYIKFNVLHPDTKEKVELTRRIRGYVRIKEHLSESHRRPIVRLRVMLANIDEHINFTLVDRSKFAQQVLIGRNLLQDLAIVDVSQKFTAQSADNINHEQE